MSSVHDTITEALRAHKINLRRIDHPRLGGVLLNITTCTGCDWTTEAINASGEDEHLEHRAEEVASALSAAGFVVRKQVEPALATTQEELDALPFLSVIREKFRPSPSGANYGGVYERRTSGWQCIAGVYKDGPDNGSPKLPCRVLYDPEQVEP